MTTRSAVSRVASLACLTVVLVLGGWFVAAQILPSLMGWMPAAVLSHSMTGTHNRGDAVILDRLDTREEKEALQVGDVITYLPKPNNPEMTTHRIIGVGTNADGVRTFRTQGDANPTPDNYEHDITHEQIRAKVLYGVPFYGHVLTNMPEGYAGYAKPVLGVLVGLYILRQVVGLVVPSRRCNEPENGSGESDSPPTDLPRPAGASADREGAMGMA